MSKTDVFYEVSMCEIERFNRLENRARRVLRAFDKERDRLTWEQWRALEDLEEAVYVRQAE